MNPSLETTTSSHPRSRLLELPAELRTYLFELSVVSEKPLVTFRLDRYQRDTLQEATQPAVTRASKQLRRESLLLFYSCNTFILHAESSKAEQGHAWARCSEAYLGELTSARIWLRYVTLTNARAESNGALSVSLQRAKAGDPWIVGDHWDWITVTRKPPGISLDAGFIMGSLRRLVSENQAIMDTADGLFAMIMDLKNLYVKEKMS